jgi:TolA-binding protein
MPSGRPPLSEDQVASVFRSLATEHSLQREATSRRLSWERIQSARNHAFARSSQWFSRPLAKTFVIAPLVAGAAAGSFLWLNDDSLRYEVTGEVRTDRGVLRTEQTAATLDFTDDSAVIVDANSAVDVEIAGDHAALVRLLSGKLRVGVKHHEETAWRFLAGPYEVRVIGTRFDLAWEPASESFSVAMREGRVRVLGPGRLDRYLLAGERLDLRADRRVAQAESAAPAPRTNGEKLEGETSLRAPSRRNAPAPKADAASGPDWTTLVSTGRFAEVVESAESLGIDAVLTGHGAQDLRALASAARYSGHTPLAIRTWNALRQRFGGHDAGRQAAFFLGRTYDEKGQSALALRSLNEYLRESPSGVYAAEALGRRLALVQRLEGGEAARSAASEYLNRFPKGSYAQMARGLLAER